MLTAGGTKLLNSLAPTNWLMGDASYSETTYSAYERSKIASRGISAVAGIAALVGASYSAIAQEARPIAYTDTNLAQYGVPNFDGQKPLQTKWLDLSLDIPGAESRFDVFKAGEGLVATYTIDEKLYGVLFDKDGKKPLDSMYMDMNGSGNFEPYSPRELFTAPSWVTR